MNINNIKCDTLTDLSLSAKGFDTATMKPVFIGEDKIEDKNHYAVWNNDRKKVSSIVSPQYELIQHSDVVSEVIESLQGLNLKGTARVSDGGDVVFIDITFNDAKLFVTKGEEFYQGIRIVNSYNKTTGIQVMPHLVRLACNNGMVMSVNFYKEFNVTHTSKLAKDFSQIIPVMLNTMVTNNDKFKQLVESCIGDSVEWDAMKTIIANLLKCEKHQESVLGIINENGKKEKYSRWDFYCAITSYATHSDRLSPTLQNFLQNKAQVVLQKPLSRMLVEVSR